MSSLEPARPSLVRFLDEIVAWESRAASEIEAGLQLVGHEERAARRLAAEASRRLAALAHLRRDQGDELVRIEQESQRRRRRSVGTSLGLDRDLVLARARGDAEAPGPAGVGVLVSAEPATGPTRALLLVLPVPFAVYEEGVLREEDLSTFLAYRAVAAVHEVLLGVGCGEAAVRFAPLHGCLAIQVWVGESEECGELREPLMARIGAAFEGARELHAAGLEVYAVWIAPELLAEGAE